MQTLLCWNCGHDTGIEATDDDTAALCEGCEHRYDEADESQYIEANEFVCPHDLVAQTAGGREYCADCGMIFQ